MIEHERLAITEDVALSPVSAGFANLWELLILELIGVHLIIRYATAAPTDFLK